MPRERLQLGDTKYHQIPEQLTTRQVDRIETEVREFLAEPGHDLFETWIIAYDFEVVRHAGGCAIILWGEPWEAVFSLDRQGHGPCVWFEAQRILVKGDPNER